MLARETPSDKEIKQERWGIVRSLGSKGYVQLKTTLGDLNLEIRADVVPATAENFLTLCARGESCFAAAPAWIAAVPPFIECCLHSLTQPGQCRILQRDKIPPQYQKFHDSRRRSHKHWKGGRELLGREI